MYVQALIVASGCGPIWDKALAQSFYGLATYKNYLTWLLLNLFPKNSPKLPQLDFVQNPKGRFPFCYKSD